MKTKKIFLILWPVLVLILEALPTGAVLCFAVSPSEKIRKTFSYFSLTVFGNANFGPLITAVLSCILLILAVLVLVTQRRGFALAFFDCSIAAFIISLFPILYGMEFYSFTGAGISFLSAAEIVTSMLFLKQKFE